MVYGKEYITCQDCDEKIEKHIIEGGARYHIPYWDSLGKHCSEEDCEINHICREKLL